VDAVTAGRPLRLFAEPQEALERLTGAIERMSALGTVTDAFTGPFSNLVKPGRLKDVLSGTWLAHPVHPVLTDVVIGAWTSAFVLDATGDEGSRRAADTLIGVGVLAAVPTIITGLSDLSDVERPAERRIGAAHLIANLTAVVLYGGSYLVRKAGSRRAGTVLSLLGITAVSAGGFLGGHLTFRKGLGVDTTAFQTEPRRWTPVLDDAELSEATAKRVLVNGTDLLLYRDGETIHALANRCSHRGGPLHKGKVADGQVTCPWHLSTFRLADGSIVRGPATAPQPSYEVRVESGQIQIRARR
jgi:nitrite reductase/ring-hydroxylating ferredoxin subunit/uncharacterized membrane protein